MRPSPALRVLIKNIALHWSKSEKVVIELIGGILMDVISIVN